MAEAKAVERNLKLRKVAANERLIKAAPELLAIIRAIVSDQVDFGGSMCGQVLVRKALLDKAKALTLRL